MNILITGGAGFVGSQTGYYLNEKGHTVFLLDNMSFGHDDNLNINGETFGTFILGDVRDDISDILIENNIDAVIHLAGIAPLPDCQVNPIEAIDNNLNGTVNVLECCRKTGVGKILFSSTSAIYENCQEYPFREDFLDKEPDLMYSMTKYMAESVCKSYVENYDMDINILRFFNVYGPHQDFKRKKPPLMGYIVKCMIDKTSPTFYSSGNQKRDYVYIEDVVSMMEILLNRNDISGEIFNVCSGETYSVREIYDLYKKIFNENLIEKYRDPSKFWDEYENLFVGKYPLSKDRIEREVNKYSFGSYQKAKSFLGWHPKTNLSDGVQNCVSYVKEIENKKEQH